MKPFEELIAEAESRSFEGWNFSTWMGRLPDGPLPWDTRGSLLECSPTSIRSWTWGLAEGNSSLLSVRFPGSPSRLKGIGPTSRWRSAGCILSASQ